jgi:hypothetical protein
MPSILGVERRMLIGLNSSQSLKVRRFREDRVAHTSSGIVLCQIQYLRSITLFHHGDSSLLYFPITPRHFHLRLRFCILLCLLPSSKPTHSSRCLPTYGSYYFGSDILTRSTIRQLATPHRPSLVYPATNSLNHLGASLALSSLPFQTRCCLDTNLTLVSVDQSSALDPLLGLWTQRLFAGPSY